MKIEGNSKEEAMKALKKIALEMPQVCIMDTHINATFSIDQQHPDININTEGIIDYFSGIGVGEISPERCANIISKSGEKLGEYDFYFEWFEKPTTEEIKDLKSKIDKSLKDLGVKYRIVTK